VGDITDVAVLADPQLTATTVSLDSEGRGSDGQRLWELERLVHALQEELSLQRQQLKELQAAQQQQGTTTTRQCASPRGATFGLAAEESGAATPSGKSLPDHIALPVSQESQRRLKTARSRDLQSVASLASEACNCKSRILKMMDRFHNQDSKRRPSAAGCACTAFLLLAILMFTTMWIVMYDAAPPGETYLVNWSAFGGDQPMEVECVSSKCWLWFSGCGEGGAAEQQCIEMHHGERRTIGMCYMTDPRHGLTVKWLGANESNSTEGAEGLRVWSEMDFWTEEWDGVMPTGQLLLPGFQLATLVTTQNKTCPDGHVARHRTEWFITYSSPEVPEALHTPSECHELNDHYPGAQTARVLMMPQFFEKVVEKEPMWLPLFAALGGAFEFLDGFCHYLYLPLYILLGKMGLHM